MARARTGLNTRDFAKVIGVSHGTITNAECDKVTVRPITVNAYALATGVDRKWLETGETPARPEPDGGLSVLPRLDSNQQPSGYLSTEVTRLDDRRPGPRPVRTAA